MFAPTDAAFTAAGIDLATLDTPEGKAALSDILLYHVYAGSITTADITEGQILMMANGDNATLCHLALGLTVQQLHLAMFSPQMVLFMS